MILLLHSYKVKVFVLKGNFTLNLLNTYSSTLTKSLVIEITRPLKL